MKPFVFKIHESVLNHSMSPTTVNLEEFIAMLLSINCKIIAIIRENIFVNVETERQRLVIEKFLQRNITGTPYIQKND